MKTPSKREILVLTGHLCPKCDEFTELVESSEIYGTDFGLLYRCPTCHAYVGCHKGVSECKGECRRKKPSGTSRVGPPLVRRYVEIRGYES